MENYTIHRCPKCDTIHKGNVCIVCGEILSDNVQEKNVQASPPKSNIDVKKYKILFFVSILLAILVTATVTAIIVEKRTSQMYIGQLEVTNTMNKNAQVVYSTAQNYCLKSIENKAKIADGFYSFEIENGAEKMNLMVHRKIFSHIFQFFTILIIINIVQFVLQTDCLLPHIGVPLPYQMMLLIYLKSKL